MRESKWHHFKGASHATWTPFTELLLQLAPGFIYFLIKEVIYVILRYKIRNVPLKHFFYSKELLKADF